MEETYFVIHNSDGDTHVEQISKSVLLNRLDENYYGKVNALKSIKETDTNYWGENILIIKGKIVTPQAEEVIVKNKID
ncbi:MAG TPA: hypothetical protein VK172_10195 [Lentimicrobium sp.]|nr:hypothetical protein [Lentimicrobium sp.]